MQAEWCNKILNGEKKVECRQYALPPGLHKQPIFLIATSGVDGIPSLGNTTPAGSTSGEICGLVTFSNCVCYDSADSFAADEGLHGVPPNSVYAWQGENFIEEKHLTLLFLIHQKVKNCSSCNPHRLISSLWLVYHVIIYSFSLPVCVLIGSPVYGWVVGGSKRIEPSRPLPALERIHRSIHRVLN